MSVAATANDRWTAAHCRVLGRLFAIAGAAGATGAPPDAALALTSLAGLFAWHAELLGQLLPTRAGVDAAELVARPLDGADRALDRVAGDAEPSSTCVVLARVVVPRLLAGVEVARAHTDARLDGPQARALTLVARDLRDALGVLEPIAERVAGRTGRLRGRRSAVCRGRARPRRRGRVRGVRRRRAKRSGGLTAPVE